LSWGENRDATEDAEFKQVAGAGDDDFRLPGDRGGEYPIILGVASGFPEGKRFDPRGMPPIESEQREIVGRQT